LLSWAVFYRTNEALSSKDGKLTNLLTIFLHGCGFLPKELQMDCIFVIPTIGSLTLIIGKAKISQTLKYAILWCMRTPSAEWTKWAETLSRFQLDGIAAWLLEASEPLLLIGAQFIYFGQPVLGNERLTKFAQFLEDKEETRAFAAFLRKE
jgi:hypothetical protein